MLTPATNKIVIFTRPFRLSVMTHRLPPGSYTVETTEQQLDGGSVKGTRQSGTGTFLRVPLPPGAAGASSRIMIDPVELEAALARDAAPEHYGPEIVAEPAAAHEESRS